MIFDLGFGFWEGGHHAVAIPTKVIFERQLNEVAYFPWGRWNYFVMQDGVIVTYPIKIRSNGNVAVMFLELSFGLNRAFHDLREFHPFTPFQISIRDPSCQSVCRAASTGILGGATPEEMLKMDEDVWCLQKNGWFLIRGKSMLAIGLELPNEIVTIGGSGVVKYTYADQNYDPNRSLANPPLVS
jgi:hypothetical protein